jgi:hypothetical protein
MLFVCALMRHTTQYHLVMSHRNLLTHLRVYLKQTNTMDKTLSWEPDSRWAGQEIPVITMFTTARHWTLYEPDESSPHYFFKINFNSILPSLAKKTQHFTITKINWLTLFKEIIAVYSENHTKPINTTWRVVEAGGTYCYNWALKG